MRYRKLFRLYSEKRKLLIAQYLNYEYYVSFIPWDRVQIDIKLGKKASYILRVCKFEIAKGCLC